ncbi:c-type cytochrome biogenesis protein CcmI [Inquilinus sp. CAU 1745]|uniref:c-type cytochrome biogenesis protein CcmI n=1 Tax=Inquilinus sp. CAU 1745 TaxID=3140369 RepID=UPI00325B4EEB
MIFWIVAALLTAGAVALLLTPLMKARTEAPARAEHDLAVYRDQLAEVDRDRARGLVTDDQAEAARAEIGRRMLAASRNRRTIGTPGGRGPRWAAMALMIAIPLAALAIYLPVGRPGLPAQPFAARDGAAMEARAALAADAATLERRLVDEPENPLLWVELAQIRSAMGDLQRAVEAYGRAVGLTEGDPVVTSAYAEALVRAGSGIVTEEARLAFESVLERLPDDPRARFYLAQARLQAGDLAGALERWVALAEDTPADAPWRALIEERIADAAARLNVPPPEIAFQPPPSPTAEDVEAAAAMSGEERAEMIRGMVDGLAARLEENPDDLEGWLRLGEARRVLGQEAEALAAFDRAAALAPDDPVVLSAQADAWLAMEDGRETTPEFAALMERIHALDPDNLRALWFLGVRAASEQRYDDARAHWRRALGQLEPGTEAHGIIEERLEALPAE